jgi:serine protease Do
VLVWAEVGRTDTLRGTLAGLSGAPALDSAGRVIGVTVAEAPRRGRIYTTAPETLKTVLAARRRPAAFEFRPASRSPPRTTAAWPTACAASCGWRRWCA